MASQVSICNQAISRLGGNLITSIDDQSEEAQLCKANYDNIRAVVFQEQAWSFATARYVLPKVDDGAAYAGKSQFSSRYLLPSEIVNVIRASDNPDDRNTVSSEWRVEGEHIVTDSGSPLYVKAIIDVTDTSKFSPMFTQAFALRLASEICMAVTNSLNLQRSLMQEYGVVLGTAAVRDGMQGTPEQIRTKRYLRARR